MLEILISRLQGTDVVLPISKRSAGSTIEKLQALLHKGLISGACYDQEVESIKRRVLDDGTMDLYRSVVAAELH